ncbi:hypothetical protein CONPUDRAFT_44592 [Coniophora puteana RWD-64-598 SS2]|uniref:RNase H type-1 domain-containing protein n=1 Tax=Coniophora puteana (strain RWD-64-598) TaxID=741705 RepID=A0A5M3N561_CONPW|nr:uncharacterized protein CONPUDRAFT_44592 [Coniophora puteana RWD-64-598 SS2]EIW86549.1 hypothetical protein CONPUDRAFT_44592 [Coniophora puteana RWD-64-598 SS2]
MGVWIPHLNAGFFAPIFDPDQAIAFYETLAVHCALVFLAASTPAHRRILIHCDNQVAVHLYSSFAARRGYNTILRASVDILLARDWDLRVRWLPTEDNEVADALSRQNFMRLADVAPDLHLIPFAPPPELLGARAS